MTFDVVLFRSKVQATNLCEQIDDDLAIHRQQNKQKSVFEYGLLQWPLFRSKVPNELMVESNQIRFQL